jgi:hypothetical protein
MANTIAAGDLAEMFQYEVKIISFLILDDDGDPVDLSGQTLRFVLHDSNDPPTYWGKEEGGDIDMTDAASGIIGVEVGSPTSDIASTELHYRLWDVTGDEVVLAHGPFKIHPAVQDAP